jgi:hypothetical protein
MQTTVPFTIGSRQSGYFFNGTIDEVKIYNRSLTAGEVWQDYVNGAKRLGLATTGYRFEILLNNTKENLVNQSANASDLTSELVSFDYSDLGFSEVDVNSTVILDEDNNTVSYNINGDNITFVTSVNANQTKWFTVYFDIDSNFTSMSTSVSGSNNVTETLYPIEQVNILQYQSIMDLAAANYTIIKNTSDIENQFNITLDDTNGTNVLSFGNVTPSEGDIIALQRYVMYQNATGYPRQGKIIVRVW